mmetsp:Transcript_94778/g.225717  ORF Transcript_94778/g.225717 Transcript_94778/m.225717 type:complete len:335 (+) Transcript_94778:280-1284(+)
MYKGLHCVVQVRLRQHLEVLLPVDVLVDDVLDLHAVVPGHQVLLDLQDVAQARHLAGAGGSAGAAAAVEQENLVGVGHSPHELIPKGRGGDGVEPGMFHSQAHQWQLRDLQLGRPKLFPPLQFLTPPLHFFFTLGDHGIHLAGERVPNRLGVRLQKTCLRQNYVSHDKRSHSPQWHRVAPEDALLQVDEGHVLQASLPRSQRGRHRRPGLDHVELPPQGLLGLYLAVVLMSPNHEVQEGGQHLLVDARLAGHSSFVALVPVLVQDHHVEPFLRVDRSLETDFAALEAAVQPLVPDVPQAVDRHLRPALSEQQWADDNVLQILMPPKVVAQPRHL